MGTIARRKYIEVPNNYWESSLKVKWLMKERDAKTKNHILNIFIRLEISDTKKVQREIWDTNTEMYKDYHLKMQVID